jgi:hypothetical protein
VPERDMGEIGGWTISDFLDKTDHVVTSDF